MVSRSWLAIAGTVRSGSCIETLLKVMRASDDPKQTRIGSRLILGVVHDQLYLAADALKSCFHLEFQKIAGVARRGRVGQRCSNDRAWSRS